MDAIAAAQDVQRRVGATSAPTPMISRAASEQPALLSASLAALVGFLDAPMRNTASEEVDAALLLPAARAAVKRANDSSDAVGQGFGKRRRSDAAAVSTGSQVAAERRKGQAEVGVELHTEDRQVAEATAVTPLQPAARARAGQDAVLPAVTVPGAVSASAGKRKTLSASSSAPGGVAAKRPRHRLLLQESQTEYVRVQPARRASDEGEHPEASSASTSSLLGCCKRCRHAVLVRRRKPCTSVCDALCMPGTMLQTLPLC